MSASPPAAARRRAAILPFGCQMNRHDAEVARGLLTRAGWDASAAPEDADAVVLFTCAVRQHAEDRVWSRLGVLRKLKRKRQNLVLALAGCMAQRHGEAAFRREAALDLVAGSGQLERLPELLERARAGERVCETDLDERVCVASSFAHRARPFQAWLAVMRGCSCRCAYCIVPSVRGPERSRPPGDVLADARALVHSGALEITLLGQNIDRYGRDLEGNASLARLLSEIAPFEAEGLKRLRFVTSHPRDVTDELLDAMDTHAVACERLHAPAQSGSARVLAAMGRGYAREDYLRLVERARSRMPKIALASDFIVGFPGETEAEFEETLSLAEGVRFAQAFMFKYSPRPGTRAAEMADDVPPAVKAERHARLSKLQERVQLERHRGMIGCAVEVLVEGPSARDASRATGRTRTGEIVTFPADGDSLAGRLVEVNVTDATALTLAGEMAPR